MNLAAFKSLVLRAHLALRHFGWGNATAILLMMPVAAAWLVWVPQAGRELEEQRRTLQRMRVDLQSPLKAEPAPVLSTNEERLAAFYQTLGERRYAEQQVKALFAVAAKTNLALNKAEYRLAADKHGRFHTYQVILPVKGSYGAIRLFCEQVLLTIPFASLGQVIFKRDTISSHIVETQLHFTLYLADALPHGPPNTMVNAASAERFE